MAILLLLSALGKHITVNLSKKNVIRKNAPFLSQKRSILSITKDFISNQR